MEQQKIINELKEEINYDLDINKAKLVNIFDEDN